MGKDLTEVRILERKLVPDNVGLEQYEQTSLHCKDDVLIMRYADDFVCGFQYRKDAIKFFKVLPKRLAKLDLSVAPEKTGMMRFSLFHPSRRRRIIFLGFEIYWTKDQKGLPGVV